MFIIRLYIVSIDQQVAISLDAFLFNYWACLSLLELRYCIRIVDLKVFIQIEQVITLLLVFLGENFLHLERRDINHISDSNFSLIIINYKTKL